MAVVDSQGRLFGKVSILDLGAALVILLVLVGIFVFPGASGSIAQGSTTKPMEVEVVVRVAAQNVEGLLKPGEKTSIVIRNQPYGEVKIKSVKALDDNVYIPLPDGKAAISVPDPRPETNLSKNLLVTLEGNAQITKNGPVLGNNKIKIGTPIELEGFNYNFSNLNVRDIRILEKS